METIYAIPGLGVDHRLFTAIQPEGAKIVVLKWNSPKAGETLPAYALRLAEQMDTSRPFSLLGVSFGGMCAVEIAKRFPPRQLFLVSTSKCRRELPLLIRLARYLPLHRLFSDAAMAKLAVVFKNRFGVLAGEQQRLFYAMLCANPPQYFRDTITAIARWENETVPARCLHLHGSADRLIPARLLRNEKTDKRLRLIENGTHFMILNEGRRITEIIDESLTKSN